MNVFLEAEAEVSRVIRGAAARAAGDPWRALDHVREWANAVPGRRRLLVQAQRYRIAPLPVLEEALAHAHEVIGDGDEDVVCGLVAKFLEAPEACERLDRELAERALEALVTWIDETCAAWREGCAG